MGWDRRVLHVLWLALAAPSWAATQRGEFDQPPFVHGNLPAQIVSIGHAGVTFREELDSLDPTPERSAALAALLDSLNAALTGMRVEGVRLAPLSVKLPEPGAPDIAFGCRRGGVDAEGFPRAPSEIDPTEPRRMTFEVEGPSKAWKSAAATDGHDATLVVQLRFGEYWVRQKSWKGTKQIELGTGRAMPVPWLTSLDDPVQVIQLTAALVSREGKVLRVGAEGIVARRTRFKASMAGLQEVLTEDDLAALYAPSPDGAVPAWRQALLRLLTQMTAAKKTSK